MPAIPLPERINPFSRPGCQGHRRFNRRPGFSLIEMLVSIFILGTGMLMVAGVFPVAIKWTNQDTQRTVAQVVAGNALGMIESQYAGTNPPQVIGPIPYAYGTDHPYTVQGLASIAGNSSYYWCAYLTPILSPTGGSATDATTFRVSIFVFNSPDPSAKYPTSATGGGEPLTTDGNPSYPQLFYGPFKSVTAVGGDSTMAMPIGALGEDMTTGSTFRVIVDPASHAISMSGLLPGTTTPNDYVIYAPPANGQAVSSLVYIYETTVNL